MKAVILVLLMFGSSDPELSRLRNQFLDACTNEKALNNMLGKLHDEGKNSSIYRGYYAAATILQAKYSFNPVSKLNYCKKGLPVLDSLISKNENNHELHYLRFSMESNIPSILNMGTHVDEDKKILIGSLDKLNDLELKKMIISTLKNSKRCSEEEMSYLATFHLQ